MFIDWYAVRPRHIHRPRAPEIRTPFDRRGASRARVKSRLWDLKLELVLSIGTDSDLYGAMGYVRKSQRQSGLTQKSNAAAPQQTTNKGT